MIPGTVDLHFDSRLLGDFVVRDNGYGQWTHNLILSSRIDYVAGTMLVKWNAPPDRTGPSTWIEWSRAPVPNCTVDIDFTPSAAGPFIDTFMVQGLKPIGLNGTGVAAVGTSPYISVAPETYVGFMSTQFDVKVNKTLTVSNGGAVDNLDLSSITSPATPFSLDYASDCGALPITLTPGSSCDIVVYYQAQTTDYGPHYSSFEIASNDVDKTPVVIGLGGSSTDLLTNIPPNPAILVSPVNGAMAPVDTAFDFIPGTDDQICIGDDNPPGCDPTQSLTNTIHLASDRAFQNRVLPVAGINSGISYAMVFGNPVFLIALFGIVATGVFLRRKKITVLLVAGVFVTGLLFVACGGQGGVSEQSTPSIGGGGGGGGVALVVGQTYYWKVLTEDGVGGIVESDTWSFTTQ